MSASASLQRKYYFNPNASPDELYPLIPYLLLLGHKVALWEPQKQHIIDYLNLDLWNGLLAADSEYRGKLDILCSPQMAKSYEDSASKIDQAIFCTLDRSRVRAPELVQGVVERTKYAWREKSHLAEIAIEKLLHDIEVTGSHDLDHFADIGKRNGMSLEWAMFDSVAQDIAMLLYSGAQSPLCRPERWCAYISVFECLEDGGASVEANLPQPEVLSYVETEIDGLLERLSAGAPAPGIEEDHEVRRLSAKFVEAATGLSSLDYSEFRERQKECWEANAAFRTLERELMLMPGFGGSALVERIGDIVGKLGRKMSKIERLRDLATVALPLAVSGVAWSAGGSGALAGQYRDVLKEVATVIALGAYVYLSRDIANKLLLATTPKPHRIILQHPEFFRTFGE